MDANVASIGDWLTCEAIVPLVGDAYRLTVFCRHGPTVLKRIEEFDRQFDGLLHAAGQAEGASRAWAVDKIKAMIRSLDVG